jgi:peptidoglycan L-alanyl-D-glutamate endopeptidase CwlK
MVKYELSGRIRALHLPIALFHIAVAGLAIGIFSLPSRADASFFGKKYISQNSPIPGPGWNAEIDRRSEKTIKELDPVVKSYARELVRRAAAKGIDIKVISGYRSIEEQERLYCQGRNIPECRGLYKPGPIVTNAKGGESNHNFRIAFDIGVFQGTKYLPRSPHYTEVGKIGRSLGLEWGGDWTTFKDQPHFQLRPKWAAELSEKEMRKELLRRSTATPKELFYP